MSLESDETRISELQRQLGRLRIPFSKFIGAQSTASALLLLALFAALFMANSTWRDSYETLTRYPLGLLIGGDAFEWSLRHLVNDGLIAFFFLLIGLEFKRELLVGELTDPARMRFLGVTAAGGMVLPALLYLLINLFSDAGQVRGWGIPMATDTAIAIGVLMALGSRVPKAVFAFLIGLAIIDDIGAILVIALFYTEHISLTALLAAAGLLAALLFFNRAGLRHPLVYAAGGVLLWIAIVRSGIHASIAGAVIAAAVPARPRIRPDALPRKVQGVVEKTFPVRDEGEVLADARTHERITRLEELAQAATTPLRRWENVLELPVALIVLPLFVFLNAGIPIDGTALRAAFVEPVSLGVMIGLVVGKPCGILAGVFLGELTGWARRPAELSRYRLLGAGLLAGIGFTMSTFIANLALGEDGESIVLAKLGILLASTIAAIAGYLVLRAADNQCTGS
jgi:Na+:H+ antiporter, NhaA family